MIGVKKLGPGDHTPFGWGFAWMDYGGWNYFLPLPFCLVYRILRWLYFGVATTWFHRSCVETWKLKARLWDDKR